MNSLLKKTLKPARDTTLTAPPTVSDGKHVAESSTVVTRGSGSGNSKSDASLSSAKSGSGMDEKTSVSSNSHGNPVEARKEWTVETKRSVDTKKLLSLRHGDETELIRFDHFLEGAKCSTFTAKRNWLLKDFGYHGTKDNGHPFIILSNRCGCDHEMAGEQVLNGQKLKKGNLVNYTLADMARRIQNEWTQCPDRGESEAESNRGDRKPTLRLGRTHAL